MISVPCQNVNPEEIGPRDGVGVGGVGEAALQKRGFLTAHVASRSVGRGEEYC